MRWLQLRGRQVPAQEAQLSTVAVRELRECFDGLDTRGEGYISLPHTEPGFGLTLNRKALNLHRPFTHGVARPLGRAADQRSKL